jgi:hypothetical protein
VLCMYIGVKKCIAPSHPLHQSLEHNVKNFLSNQQCPVTWEENPVIKGHEP